MVWASRSNGPTFWLTAQGWHWPGLTSEGGEHELSSTAENSGAKMIRALIALPPILNQLHDIANVPEPICNASGHRGRHANAAVDTGEVIPLRCRSRQPSWPGGSLGMIGTLIRA